MTQYGVPFDGILTGDAAVAPYSAAEWARIWRLQHGVGVSFPNYGVFAGSGDGTHPPLEVRATTIVSTNIEVQIGAAQIDGRFYESTAAETLAVGANASGNPRIDTVILRLDYIAQTIRLVIKQGTPAGSPSRPTMQQDATYWEIPLADIAVANGFATLAQSTITQRQRIVTTQSMGWQAYAHPMNYALGQAVGNVLNITATHTVLFPIMLYANMLLQDLLIRVTTVALTPYQFGWDLYVEDTNEGNTSENTLRRVARSNADVSGNLPGSATFLPASVVMGGTIPLSAGVYWLAFQNRHATDALPLDTSIGGWDTTFDHLTRRKATTNPNGDTLDAVTGWTTENGKVPCIVLRGRVLGMTNALP